ncbi:ShlB/FhaC/HecB family hemolysin secretion/activation protein [Thiomicrospira sp. ALE5]|uniref:ShlB/FhaC/HecB family hemolysin secretion/activation protein n=1 Tax=Thiomicrospira sp. ALE5 TaxID=748650 RepID=UPI0008E3FDEE|nr:ShlB/FhaC/HecB family hemolysin secretion/activation protein [Thiomicrospira sp. ALE5]SFR60724.1 Hemolysin activation/secretion protein [Thiomicrospira sp. ALE5]
MLTKHLFLMPLSVATFFLSTSLVVVAQTVPDSGRIFQDSMPQSVQPLDSSTAIDFDSRPLTETQPGGPKVLLNDIKFLDNTVFSDVELLVVLGDVLGQHYDLAGLRDLANKVSSHYRINFYPFASAIIPAQDMSKGILVIQVIEGRYGNINATGKQELADFALPYIRGLNTGDVIESRSLERKLLIIGDIPGIAVVPVMRPSEIVGAGDLDLRVGEAPRMQRSIGVDNHGSRFSGEYRIKADFSYARLFTVGDEVSLTALYSNEELVLGQISYSIPIGYSGLKGYTSYSQTEYELGADFAALGATGIAKVSSLGLSYPVLRSQQTNVVASVSYSYKELKDERKSFNFIENKTVKSIPLAIQFDNRDNFLGGGILFGSVQFTTGRLRQNNSEGFEVLDSFSKTNLNLSRVQRLSNNTNFFGVFITQDTPDRNLDSSESFSLGGVNGVRAFPSGEGADSTGWLTKLELRHTLNHYLSPYLFYDLGSTPRGGLDDERRTISGAGLGLRYNLNGFNVDFSSAWKVTGGNANSDNKQADPRLWFSASYLF